MQTGGFDEHQILSSYWTKYHIHCMYTAPLASDSAGWTGHASIWLRLARKSSQWPRFWNQVSGPGWIYTKIAYFQVVSACNPLKFERGASNMNPHAFQICADLWRWRRSAEILIIINKLTAAFIGMPHVKEFSVKELCVLYIQLDQKLQHTL